MKFVAMRPCEFYVDQLFNLRGNDELYAQTFVPIVARALQRARLPQRDWVAWYAAWKVLTPTVGLAADVDVVTKRADVDVRDWGMVLFFYEEASDRRWAMRWAKRTLAVLRRG
jgi:hypothetical protein